VVSVLGIGHKSSRIQAWPRAIKIHSTTEFEGEIRPVVPCRKMLRNVKEF
jgi:hypothetical protein